MRPVSQVTNGGLLALKIAMAGYQQFRSSPEIAIYFKQIIDAIIGLTDPFDAVAIQQQINAEETRRRNAPVQARLARLTRQELRVLKLSGEGYRNDQIANEMSISYKAVANYKRTLAAKLGLSTARDLQKFAIENIEYL